MGQGLLRLLFAAVMLAGAAAPLPGFCADARSRADFFAATLFVASRGSDRLTLIDIDRLEVTGFLPVGLSPRYLAVSDRLGLIAAGDGGSKLSLTDAASGESRVLAFDFAPSRFLLSPDGLQLAAVDPAGGVIALIDVAEKRETGRISQPGPLRDELFSSDSQTLFVARDGQAELLAFGARRGEARPWTAAGGPFSALARSPNGRAAFAREDKTGNVKMLDLTRSRPPGSVPVGGGGEVYVTGTGRFVLAPDSAAQRLLVVSTEPFQTAASLRGAPKMTAAYSAWFDLYAFVSSAERRALLVYDLEGLTALDDIPLGGRPGKGAVSPDGSRLFLPIEEAGAIDVVDARYRRIARSIRLDSAPVAVAMAGSYGICH